VFNRVIHVGDSDDACEPQVAVLQERFQSRSAGVAWILGPEALETDLPELLARHGLRPVQHGTAMALDLRTAALVADTAPAIRIREVADWDTHRHWLAIVREVFDLSAAATEVFTRVPVAGDLDRSSGIRGRIAWGEGRPERVETWRRFVAYRGEHAVATATLVCDGVTAGVYLVGTRPSARRQGLVTALVRHVVRLTGADGYSVVVLKATDQGVGVYERIGFQPLGAVVTYGRTRPRARVFQTARSAWRFVRATAGKLSADFVLSRRRDASLATGARRLRSGSEPGAQHRPVPGLPMQRAQMVAFALG
jgi:ribosomal protein S18 acetylase RimI-like enzyme